MLRYSGRAAWNRSSRRAWLARLPLGALRADELNDIGITRRRNRAHAQGALERRNEALRVRGLEPAADAQIGDRRVRNFHLSAVIAIEFRHDVREALAFEPEPTFGPR